MNEFEPHPEELLREKADKWLDDVTEALSTQYSDVPLLEPDDQRFLEKVHRGMELSSMRLSQIASLYDHRESFYEEKGVDIILEQYYTLKLLVERRPS
jgi:hypothetical protein